MADSGPEPARVFISYSHQDRRSLDQLHAFLRPLEHENAIARWDDSRLVAGTPRREEIKAAIESADVAILLVSQPFLASDFIAKDELPPLLEAAEQRGLVILPVILSHCTFKRSKLSRYQAVNDPERPLEALQR